MKITTKDDDKIELRIVELTSEAIRGNKTEQGILGEKVKGGPMDNPNNSSLYFGKNAQTDQGSSLVR